MQLVQLVCNPSWSWFGIFSIPTHLNQIDSLWQHVMCHPKHLWQNLILVRHLWFHQYYPPRLWSVPVQLLTPVSHQCHPNRISNLFSSSSFDNRPAPNPLMIDMFFHQIEKTVHFVLLCNCLQQTKRFQTKVLKG